MPSTRDTYIYMNKMPIDIWAKIISELVICYLSKKMDSRTGKTTGQNLTHKFNCITSF